MLSRVENEKSFIFSGLEYKVLAIKIQANQNNKQIGKIQRFSLIDLFFR